MRTTSCTVQQALAPDASAVVKQAVRLARRRGHAQVTPLHVATTMLSAGSGGLLRAACLQSHSHPLQCKALELCFNVALNRLPVASPSPAPPLISTHLNLHHHYHHPPALSNALVAAFKRAQAHQRRGSMETQQQPLLSVKIELEQLMVSILDDPSVSRVMREAGFSSSQVKSNVEQVISSSDPDSNPNCTAHQQNYNIITANSNISSSSIKPREEDVTGLVNGLLSSKRNCLVIVGECIETAEGVVKGLMDRVDKGEVPKVLRNLQFVTLPLFSFIGMCRAEVEQKVGELRCLLKSFCVGRGAVLYLEDIKWAAEFRVNRLMEKGGGIYCPVEHVIMEIGMMVEGGRGGRFWLLGISTYQSFMKCKVGNPSLEILWGLHPLTIPVGSLELSLNCDSDSQRRLKGSRAAWTMLKNAAENQHTCCTDCPIKSEKLDAQVLDGHGSTTSTLPSWLQQYKEEKKRATREEDCHYLSMTWNSTCNSVHRLQCHTSEMTTLHFSSTSPSSSSISSYNHQGHHPWSVPEDHSKLPWKQSHIPLVSENNSGAFPFAFSKSMSNPNSTSSGDTMDMDHPYKFNEVNAENLKIMCSALEKKVPWQMSIIPEIAGTILRCRAGIMMKTNDKMKITRKRGDTWLFFQGCDIEGKEKFARELATIVFGNSLRCFFELGMSSFSSTRSESSDDARNKRMRSSAEARHSFLEKLANAMRENPHRVFLLEDIEQVDLYTQVGIRRAIERGRIGSSDGEEVAVDDAIVILCCETFDSRSRACSPPAEQKMERGEGNGNEKDSCICLDLNLCAEDDETDELCSFVEDEEGLLDAVDGAFFFKLPENL